MRGLTPETVYQIDEQNKFIINVPDHTNRFKLKNNKSFGKGDRMGSTFSYTNTSATITKRNFNNEQVLNKKNFEKLKIRYLIDLKADLIHKKNEKLETKNLYKKIDNLDKIIKELETGIVLKEKEKDKLISEYENFHLRNKHYSLKNHFKSPNKTGYSNLKTFQKNDSLNVLDMSEVKGKVKRDSFWH